jgi:hypothetical protein
MTANRENPNPLSSPPPPEELALLEHPLVLGAKPLHPRDPFAEVVLEPTLPIPGPSRFLKLRTPFPGRTTSRLTEISPKKFVLAGHGCGFANYTERPRMLQSVPRPAKPPHIWTYHGDCLIVSPEVRDIFCRYDASAVEFCEIDWEYQDGTRLEGYGMLDVIRLVYAYDYARTCVDVHVYEDGRKLVSFWRGPTVLRPDLPSDLHFFREARDRRLFISRELASELAPYAGKDLVFESPHGLRERVVLEKRRRRTYAEPAPPPAIVHDLPRAADPPGADLQLRITKDILPLLEAGHFTAAEDRLAAWMRELPEGPYHVAIAPGTQISNAASEVAEYLDAFYAQAAGEAKPKVLYAEMNAFEINPEEWFFGLFAFAKDGGRESYEWTGDFYAATDENCVIRGLEPLQTVYAEAMRKGAAFPRGHDDANRIADVLVIVRFQRLLQEALAHVKHRVPLIASAHDYDEFIVEIRRASPGKAS